MQKLYSTAILDSEKYQKKMIKKQKIEKSNELQSFYQKCLYLEYIVSKFGDNIVRNDFISGENGAIVSIINK